MTNNICIKLTPCQNAYKPIWETIFVTIFVIQM
nr:MAG TPA: hypothetical protein [Caudoviricetes sp.]